ncbi:MAG: hypothetical protein QOE03_1302 [Micromonosporaceae bacterium]|jgi:hypothetical protein|nr:hypothetical protein [Micromonosporaceae bacterium]
MDDRFEVGTVVQRREVLHGQVWLSTPVRVVADDDVLAVWLAEGTPFTFPPHPFGRHPWSNRDRWTDTGVLQLHRPGDAHAIWAFFRGARLDFWYVNFQARYRRTIDGFDTVDHGLDIVIRHDGWEWKDRDDVADQVAAGRLTQAEAESVWAEAGRVSTALDRGERWWQPRWNDWRPDCPARVPDPISPGRQE